MCREKIYSFVTIWIFCCLFYIKRAWVPGLPTASGVWPLHVVNSINHPPQKYSLGERSHTFGDYIKDDKPRMPQVLAGRVLWLGCFIKDSRKTEKSAEFPRKSRKVPESPKFHEKWGKPGICAPPRTLGEIRRKVKNAKSDEIWGNPKKNVEIWPNLTPPPPLSKTD